MRSAKTHPASVAKRYIVLSSWLLVAGLFFSLAWQWIKFTSADRQFTEYVDSLLRRSVFDHRPAPQIRLLVRLKAEQLSIPVQNERINITGEGETLRTVITYDTEIKLPLTNRVLYRLEFSHNLGGEPQGY